MTDRFAFHYTPDGYSTSGPHLMGRQAAGAGLLRAIAAAPGIGAVGCFAGGQAHAAEGERLLREYGYKGRVEWIAQGRPQDLERLDALLAEARAVEGARGGREVGEREEGLQRVLRRLLRQHVDELAALALAELHHAVRGREQGVVAAAADVLARVEPGAALAHEDRAGGDDLAVEPLHAEALCCGVAAVAGGAAALGLRHLATSS